MKLAPYKDFSGKSIYEGSIIRHPSGEMGVVLYKPKRGSKWVVDYGLGS